MLRALRVPGCTLLLLALACGKSGTCPNGKVSDCFDCLRAAFTAPAETCIDPFDD